MLNRRSNLAYAYRYPTRIRTTIETPDHEWIKIIHLHQIQMDVFMFVISEIREYVVSDISY